MPRTALFTFFETGLKDMSRVCLEEKEMFKITDSQGIYCI